MFDCKCPLKTAAAEAPNALAFLSNERSLTFRELDALTEDFCLKLHQSKIGPCDRVAIFHPPTHELICLLFALWRQGASPCIMNLRLPPSQIEAQKAKIAPKLWISSFPWDPRPIEGHLACPTPSSILLFTSGSTSSPKIALLSLQSLLINATHSIPLEMGDRYLLSLPLYHVGGLGIILRCILKKATLVLNENHPDITHLSLVPTHLYRASPVYKNLKCILLGGAPVPNIPQNLPIFVTYGLTEMGSMVLAKQNPITKDGHLYLGSPLSQRKMKLSADGQIWVSGATLFQGYLDRETLSSPCEDSYFPTGDIGKYSQDLGFSILGRKDWQFISGGENIQPEEIESYLLKIPGILDAVVLPKDDPEYGKRPIACIQSMGNIDPTKVQELLSEHLPKYKIPIAIYPLSALPKTGNKTDRLQTLEIVKKSFFHISTYQSKVL